MCVIVCVFNEAPLTTVSQLNSHQPRRPGKHLTFTRPWPG